jgi:hypothetical protein
VTHPPYPSTSAPPTSGAVRARAAAVLAVHAPWALAVGAGVGVVLWGALLVGPWAWPLAALVAAVLVPAVLAVVLGAVALVTPRAVAPALFGAPRAGGWVRPALGWLWPLAVMDALGGRAERAGASKHV